MGNRKKKLGEYDPNHLLNELLSKHRLKNDTALSKFLEVSAPAISKIRHFKVPVHAGMLIRMHEVTGKSIKELRALMGDRSGMYSYPEIALRAHRQRQFLIKGILQKTTDTLPAPGPYPPELNDGTVVSKDEKSSRTLRKVSSSISTASVAPIFHADNE